MSTRNMKTETFNQIIEEQIERSRSLLVKKADEYATIDRLHNFRVAANLQGETEEQALGGMLAKHIVSIFDMIAAGDTKSYSEEMWNEKITDSMNYHLLLRAIVQERLDQQKQWEDEKVERDAAQERNLMSSPKPEGQDFRERFNALNMAERKLFNKIWDAYVEATKINETLDLRRNLQAMFTWAGDNFVIAREESFTWRSMLMVFQIKP